MLVGTIYRILFRFKIYGMQNIPENGKCIVCSNHQSNNDVVVLGMTLYKRKPVFMAKSELFKNRFIGWLLSKFEPIPVDRKNPGTKPFKKVLESLKQERLFAIFIQGTRKKEILYDDAKNGVALFAVKSEAPIIPIHIKSTFKIFSKIEIFIGEPILFKEYFGKKIKTEELKNISEIIIKTIMELPPKKVVSL